MELKAFVGHSFTDDDSDLVRKFLDYFSQLQGMSFGFSWEHAKVAESKILAEKVLNQIQDKNLFIGICTKKELVIEQNKLKKVFYNKNLQSEVDNYYWKTSDWVIQEIGLAVGRGMKLILLLEEGLRQPGGLQGSLEYIQFDRNAPEKSFGKILEMIRSLLPTSKVVKYEDQRTDTVAEAGESDETDGEKVDVDYFKPKPDWKYVDYSNAFFHAVLIDNTVGQNILADSYLETDEGRLPENIIKWQAARTYWTGCYGGAGKSVSALEKLTVENPENENGYLYLAKSYEDFKEYKKAAENYYKAGELSKDPGYRLLRFKDSANAWVNNGDIGQAEFCLSKIISDSSNDQKILDTTIETKLIIVNKEENCEQYLALLEYWLDIHPDDSDKRFNIAFKYSENEYNALAMFHYLNIPYSERKGVVWNNLGVQYARFSLNVKSINSYKKAVDDYNYTLAMSNIANKFLDAGFIKEAEEMCNKALAVENYHKNNVYSITKIKELPDQEDAKEKEELSKAKKVRDFFLEFGRAILYSEHITIEGTWMSPKCQLKVKVVNGEFTAEGTYEIKGQALGLYALQQESQVTKFNVIYKGVLTGRSILGTMAIDKDGGPIEARTLLSIGSNSKNIMMVINEAMDVINIYNKKELTESMFSQLKKL